MSGNRAGPHDATGLNWLALTGHGRFYRLVVRYDLEAFTTETPSEDLVTVATFRNYVQAQFAQCRLLASGMLAFLFDDNTIRMDWFWSTALGGVKLRVPSGDRAEALEILRLD